MYLNPCSYTKCEGQFLGTLKILDKPAGAGPVANQVKSYALLT